MSKPVSLTHLEQQQHIIVCSPSPLYPVYSKTVVDLALILKKFETMTDRLSLELYRWGAQVIAVNLTEETNNEEAFIKAAEGHIHDLFTRVLVNPMSKDRESFKEPWLDGERTWEKADLLRYIELLRSLSLPEKSSYDGKPMNPVPHLFGQQMILLGTELRAKIPASIIRSPREHTSRASSLILSSAKVHMEAKDQLKFYRDASQNIDLQYRLAQLERMCLEGTHIIDELRREMHEMNALNRILEIEHNIQHEIDLQAKWNEVETSHQVEIDLFKNQLAQERDRTSHIEDRLESEKKMRLLQEDLLKEKVALVERLQSRVQALNNSSSGRGKSCVIL